MTRKRTADTRAFDHDELTPGQVEAIDAMCALLERMTADGAEIASRSRGPGQVSDQRSARVVLLNGVRGAGKTSTLLSLAERRAQGEADRPPMWRFLPFIDLDPIPPGLPMMGWLLTAFEPVCT